MIAPGRAHSHTLPGRVDVLVVGSGPAGCVVARRCAESGRQTLLLEAGDRAAPSEPDVLDIGPGSAVVTRYPAHVGEYALDLPRGRTLGGSGAVNGGYCLPPTATDGERWPRGWAERYRPALSRVWERLRPTPVPVDAVARAAAAPWPDRLVRVPQARSGDRRRTAVDAWDPRGAGADVAAAAVDCLLWADRPGGRCAGVVTAGGAMVEAREVWLCAGALGTAAILARSGVGPATGHPIGAQAREHPELLLDAPASWAALVPRSAHPALLSSVVRLPGQLGTVEVRPYSRPLSEAVPGLPALPLRVGVALLGAGGRAVVHTDRRGVTGVELPGAPGTPTGQALYAAAAEVAERLGVTDEPIVSTSQHLAGTAPVGAVTGPDGCLAGCLNLWIADASVLPALPDRGPYVTVATVAEILVGLQLSR